MNGHMPANHSTTTTFSVVRTGMEDCYATDIQLFRSRKAAEDYARSVGGGWVVNGTQMWNEPVGQIEESDEDAPSAWVERRGRARGRRAR